MKSCLFRDGFDKIFRGFVTITKEIALWIEKIFKELWNRLAETFGISKFDITPDLPPGPAVPTTASKEEIAAAKKVVQTIARFTVPRSFKSYLINRVAKTVTPTGSTLINSFKMLSGITSLLKDYFQRDKGLPTLLTSPTPKETGFQLPEVPKSMTPEIPKNIVPDGGKIDASSAYNFPSSDSLTSNFPSFAAALATSMVGITKSQPKVESERQEDIERRQDMIKYAQARIKRNKDQDRPESWIKKEQQNIQQWENEIENLTTKTQPTAKAQAREDMSIPRTKDPTARDTGFDEESKPVTVNVLDSSQLLDIFAPYWDDLLWVLKEQQAELDLTRYKMKSIGAFT